jgi:serine/threonine-protein phosphatase 2A regulatory subunit B''
MNTAGLAVELRYKWSEKYDTWLDLYLHSLFDIFPSNQQKLLRSEPPDVSREEPLPKYGQLLSSIFGLVLPKFYTTFVFQLSSSKANGLVAREGLERFWKDKLNGSTDEERIIFKLLAQEDEYISILQLRDLLKEFAREHGITLSTGSHRCPEQTQACYADGVAIQILFYLKSFGSRSSDNWRRGRIGWPEFQQLSLASILQSLQSLNLDDAEEAGLFSLDSFREIYATFCELDTHNKMYITIEELMRYKDGALCSRVISRIFESRGHIQPSFLSLFGLPYHTWQPQHMNFCEFAWLMLCEQHKSCLAAIEYWFACLDIDADGVLSPYEIEYFWEEQSQRIDEHIPFTDIYTQLCDILGPLMEMNKIRLSDLKRSKMAHLFFDCLLNRDRFMETDHQQYLL